MFMYDLIRAACCILIFTAHYRNLNWPTLFVPRGATIGLSMFAFSSAYLLSERYSSYGIAYYKKRIIKIFPTVISILLFVGLFLHHLGQLYASPDIFIHLLGASILVYYIDIPHSGLGFGMWFVSFVLLGYIILPHIKNFFQSLLLKNSLYCCVFFSLLQTLTGTIAVSFPMNDANIYTYFTESFGWFFTGIFISVTQKKIPIFKSPLFIVSMFFISWTGMIAHHFSQSGLIQYLSISLIPFWGFPLFSFAANHISNNRTVVAITIFISSISFEIYLMHLYLLGKYTNILNIFTLSPPLYYVYSLTLCLILSYFANQLSGAIRKFFIFIIKPYPL